MEPVEQYMIYLGCNDAQTNQMEISKESFLKMIESYFKRRSVAFSISQSEGGYVDNNGAFIDEYTAIVNIIGTQGIDIIGLARGLSMFMNQEHVLVTKIKTETRYA